MGQARAKEVTFMVEKDLRFVDQSPKSGGMNNAVAVTLKGRACWSRFFWVPPAK